MSYRNDLLATEACDLDSNFDFDGERSERFPTPVTRSISTTETNEHAASVVTGAPFALVPGWPMFLAGDARGFNRSWDNGRTWEPVNLGETIPATRDGRIWIQAPAGASGTLRVEAWHPSQIGTRARSSVAVATAANAAKEPTRQASVAPVTIAALGEDSIVPPAGTIRSVIQCVDGSAGKLFVSEDAAADANGFPVEVGGAVTVYGTQTIHTYSTDGCTYSVIHYKA